jgi:hypothetical protein
MLQYKLNEFIKDFDRRIEVRDSSPKESDKHIAHGYRIVIDELEELLKEHYETYGVASTTK